MSLSNLTAPFDLVVFPSMGLFYKNKKQHILVRYLTGIEENILTSPMLDEYGIALDMALKNVVLDQDINIDELLVGDKNAILMFLRATAFGPEYHLQIVCPKCNQTGKTSFNITQMQARDMIMPPDESGEFMYVLPKMKIGEEPVVIKFRPMTYADEKLINQQDKYQQQNSGNKSISRSITLRYSNQITSINGSDDRDLIENVIKKMPIKDSASLRKFMEKVEPGIDNNIDLKCSKCSHVMHEKYDVNNSFLGLTPEYKNVIWEESFLLWYYSQGGVSRDETFMMSTAERKWALERINEELQKKHDAEKKAQESAGRSGKR